MLLLVIAVGNKRQSQFQVMTEKQHGCADVRDEESVIREHYYKGDYML